MKNKKEIKEFVKPIVLLILDGWGIRKAREGNAIALAKTPNYDRLCTHAPFTTLHASGSDVGLEPGQDGNSEAGHLNIGAGRIVLQDVVKINREINNGNFFKNPAFERAIKHVRRHDSTLHLMGLLSNHQSAHANPDQLLALLTMAKKLHLQKVVLHLFTDGRDSPRFEAIELMKAIRKAMDGVRVGSIAGRFYAMDRAKHWSRTQRVYDMLTKGEGLVAHTPEEAILQAYNRDETDEFIQPTLIVPEGEKPQIIQSHDSVIFFNLRSDRARQLTKTFVQKNFDGFKRSVICENLVFVGMTDFGPDLSILSAFPSEDVREALPMVLKAYRQLYIAENEKFAHVTYFFNGGYDHAVAGEDRRVIPSPAVKTYDQCPEMSTEKIVSDVVKEIQNKRYDFITINLAAPDMVAHTGNLKAAIVAAEVVDVALGILEKTIIKAKGMLLITADHGNIEGMKNEKTKAIDTEHSSYPVPFIVVGSKLPADALRKGGRLSDIAPTILQLFHEPQPKVMTGKTLIKGRFTRLV